MSITGDMMIGDPSGSKGKGKNIQHPTYAHLIHDAITTLRQRGGSSATAIRKTIEQKMGPTLGPNYKKIVGSTLSKMAKTGKLIKTGNTFKLSPNFRQEFRRRRRHHKKKGRRRRHRRRKKGRRRRRRRRKGRKGRGRRRGRRGRRHRRHRRSKSPKHHQRRKRRRRRRRRRRRGKSRSLSPEAGGRKRRSNAAGEKRVRHASHVHIHQDTTSPGKFSP